MLSCKKSGVPKILNKLGTPERQTLHDFQADTQAVNVSQTPQFEKHWAIQSPLYIRKLRHSEK